MTPRRRTFQHLQTPRSGKVFGLHLEFGLVAQNIEDHFLLRERMEP
jgi:hypothetical protein